MKLLTAALLLLGALNFNALASDTVRGEEPIRRGLWFTHKLPENASALEEFSRKISRTSHVDGVCLHIPWKAIEREPGKPDFTWWTKRWKFCAESE